MQRVHRRRQQMFPCRPLRRLANLGSYQRRIGGKIGDEVVEAPPSQLARDDVRERDVVRPLEIGFERPPILNDELVEAEEFGTSNPEC